MLVDYICNISYDWCVMKQYKRVHLIGIGGIGVSAMAKLLKARGAVVSGSDTQDSELLKELKSRDIKVWVGSHPERLGRDVELVIYSSAVPEDDEERVRARHLGIREVVYNEFLGKAGEGMKVVAVTGTHGKSTTTAMLGHILIEAGFDPTVVVGSKVPGFKAGNLHIGGSDLFVVEACEHKAHMLHLNPDVIVLNNIEFDHPDYYKDVDEVRDAMKKFVDKIPKDGTLVYNSQDEQIAKIVEEGVGASLASFGDEGNLSASVERESGVQHVHVKYKGAHIGDVQLHLPGEYNVMNALAAGAAAGILGVPGGQIKNALETFKGLWRRFEHLGKYGGAEVYSDYAHHPTALKQLLEGVRTFLPGKRIVMCFQPHQHARTKGLFEEFVTSLDEADVVIIPEIYGVAGRKDGEDVISSRDLVEAIGKDSVMFAKDFEETKGLLKEHVQEGDVLLMTGAGEIDNLARDLTR